MLINMNFESRLEQYCTVKLDQFLLHRKEHTFELRKKKRTLLFNSARASKMKKLSLTSCFMRFAVLLRESENFSDKYSILFKIKKLISKDTIKLLREDNSRELISEVIKHIRPSMPDQVIGEACWIVSNLALSSDCARILVKLDTTNLLLEVLSENRPYPTENALWALANICGSCDSYREMMVNYGLHNFLSNFMQRLDNKKDLKNIKVISWLFANLCTGKPRLSLIETALNVTKQLMMFNDIYIISNCLYCLVNLSELSKCADSLSNSKMAKKLIVFLYHDSLQIYKPALLIVGNLILKARHFEHYFHLDELFNAFTKVLYSEDSEVRKEVFLIISGIIGGDDTHKKEFLRHRLMISCITKLNDPSFSCQREISYIISLITDDIEFEIVLQEVGSSFFTILENALANSDPCFLMNVLEFINQFLKFDFEHLFSASGCYEKLNSLQFHRNSSVSDLAQYMIAKRLNLNYSSE